MASVTAADWQPEHKPGLTLAFCLYKYFPYGGLQRDFLHIALECQARGHRIRVYTLSWHGDIPEGFDVILVPVSALTNHTLYERFSEWVRRALLADPVDAVIGINKMPGLDVYYAADSCYEEKAHSQRNWLYRLLPRYRHFSRYERAVFGRDSGTEIFMISRVQKPFFDHHYQTQENRMLFLPPGISRDRIAPDNIAELRRRKRRELGIGDDEKLLLMAGSGFVKKGLNRALYAFKSLPRAQRARTRFIVIGEDKPGPFKRLIWILGISGRVTILRGQGDLSGFLFAADLLILPALDEAAGIILLEAVVAGLPVLATENCGYAHYVEEAGMGELVPMPFRQEELNERLARMLREDNRDRWIEKGRKFAESADIYSLPRLAAGKIEAIALENSRRAETRVIAWCLFKYFPYGGLQRDFLRIAEISRDRGYRIRVYTLSWEGQVPEGFEVIRVAARAVTNHARYAKFHKAVSEHLASNPVDCVVGFNKMPGLDVYYAADSCYEDKALTQRSWIYRQLPRYRLFSRFERAVFGRESATDILMISPVQVPLFQHHYGTQPERINILPPGIARDRIAPGNRGEIRSAFRAEMGLGEDDYLLLMVGSGFVTKGLDRALIAMQALPGELGRRTRLMAVGQDAPGSFRRMARRLGIADRVTILKGHDDIPRFLQGADLLVHPAYLENAGVVLLEAVVAGLPAIATDVCGYAHYIKEAGAGELIPSPFRQETFNALLSGMLLRLRDEPWSENGIAFSRQADIYNMPEKVADIIARKSIRNHDS